MTDREEPTTGVPRMFGQQVRLFREQRGISRTELAKLVPYGPDMIASVEQGRRIPRPEMITSLDEALAAGGVLRAATQEMTRARYPTFAQEFVAREAEAVQLHAYCTMVVHGLLQTEDYARAVFRIRRPALSDALVEQRVAARLDRQQLFTREPSPLFSFVLEEAAVRRPIGGRAAWREQLGHLLQMAERPNIDIQIMPTDRAEWSGAAGPLTILETASQLRLAYVEVQSVSRLISDANTVRELEAAYGTLRAQVLAPYESRSLIKRWLEGE